MNPKTLAIVTLRALATLFTLQGGTRQAQSLKLLASGIESGADVDAHMERVAQALEASGGSVSSDAWDDVHARIMADSESLQAR